MTITISENGDRSAQRIIAEHKSFYNGKNDDFSEKNESQHFDSL